jgi:hypothetical protein
MTIMKQRVPRVSVGVPVYNGERYLRQALDSILAQTFSDFELIISDNASTDATPEICRDYAARDPRVRYVAQETNRGAAWNVNHLVTLATAPYFTWAHADDVRAPRHIECCVAELDRASPSVIVACTRGDFIDEDDRQTGPCPDRMDLRQTRPSERLRAAIANVGWCNVLFGVIRTEVLRACRPLGGYPYADLPLAFELALRGQIREIPESLFYRRTHRPWSDEMTALHMDPKSRGRPSLPLCQIFLDTMYAIGAAGLSDSEIFRCSMVLARGWLPTRWRDMCKEFKRSARTWLCLQIDRRWGEGRAHQWKAVARRWLRSAADAGGTAGSSQGRQVGPSLPPGPGPAAPP